MSMLHLAVDGCVITIMIYKNDVLKGVRTYPPNFGGAASDAGCPLGGSSLIVGTKAAQLGK